MEVFSEKEFVPRRDMIRHVFQEHVHELEQYESANLVAYVYKKVAPSYESLLDRGLRQKEIGYENEAYLGKEELLEKKRAIKGTITEPQQSEIEKKLLVEEPKTNPDTIELKMIEKETKKPSKKEEMVVPDVVQLFQSPEMMVQPGTPRLHVAIQILLKEPRMTQQKRWIELQLQKKKLETKEEKLQEDRVALRQEKKRNDTRNSGPLGIS